MSREAVNLPFFCRSPDCFEIGWPMRLDHDFFCTQPSKKPKPKKASVSTGSVEERREDGEEVEVGVYYITIILLLSVQDCS